jgi:hypothetical protein
MYGHVGEGKLLVSSGWTRHAGDKKSGAKKLKDAPLSF